MFTGRDGIRKPYQQDHIANNYVHERYEKDPFGKALHECQSRLLQTVLASRQAKRLLEVAPGPARLTVHATAEELMCAVEQSPAMLRVARARLAEFGVEGWKLIGGDAFSLPFQAREFDFVMCFKLIRHFAREDRLALLTEMRRVLQPGGYLLFDVVNDPANRWLLSKWGVDKSWIDDHWFTKPTFCQEMQEAGFRVEAMYPVQAGLRLQFYLWAYLFPQFPSLAKIASRTLNSIPILEPLEWVALCECE